MDEIPLVFRYENRKALINDWAKVHLDIGTKEFVVTTPDFRVFAGRTNEVVLEQVTFEVNRRLQQLTRETGTKNIHARLRGIISERTWNVPSMETLEENWTELRYEPFEKDFFFVKATGEEVEQAAEVVCKNQRMFMREG